MINLYEVLEGNERSDFFREKFYDCTGTSIPLRMVDDIRRTFKSPFDAAVVHDGIHANECEVESGAERTQVLELMLDRSPVFNGADYFI